MKIYEHKARELVNAALKNGTRAPKRGDLGVNEGVARAIVRLARQGEWTIKISGHNWRVIECGKKKTAPPPLPWRVYRIIDKDGDHWLTRQEVECR